jgi:hypothetical protein
MALASAQDITLLGMITTSSVAPYNKHVSPDDYDRMIEHRAKGVSDARNSGFAHLPEPVRGPKQHLQKPDSGMIEDTQSIRSEGTELIIQQARKATAETPLVIIMGGPLTVVADAYLLDPSLQDKVIVAWLGGSETDMADYNGWADPWAAYIVLQRLRLVQFPAWTIGYGAAPDVLKQKLVELPDSPLRQWMIDKELPVANLPDGRDGDGPPAIALTRSDYVLETKRVSFSHWVTKYGRAQPAFEPDPNGKALLVTKASKQVATEEWWRALSNDKAWNAAAQ